MYLYFLLLIMHDGASTEANLASASADELCGSGAGGRMQGWVLSSERRVEMVIVIVMVSRNAAGVSGPGRECERKGKRRKCALLASKDGALIRSRDVEDRRHVAVVE